MSFNPDKALSKRLILINGDEESLRREALESLLKAAKFEKDDFDLEMTAGDSSGPVQWMGSVGTSPFLAERRCLVVRHLLRASLEDAKNVPFDKLPASSLLILVADDEGGDDSKQQTLKTASTNWAKLVKKAGGEELRFDADPAAAKEAIKAEIKRRGKKISTQVLDTFIEMTGSSLSRAKEELDKIELYVGDRDQITDADIQELVVPSREWNVFSMVQAIFNGQIPVALRHLRVLIGSQARPENAAFQKILPSVARHLRLVWQARLCLEAKCSPSSPSPEVASMFPTKPNISSESSYRAGQYSTTASRMKLSQIQKCFQVLSDTDARLKGALTGFSTFEVLERMILEMAETVGAPSPR